MKRVRKILLIAILVGAVLLLTWQFWAPRIGLLYLHYFVVNAPFAKNVPQLRTIQNPSVAAFTKYSYKNISLKVPWASFTDRKGTTTLAVIFNDNQSSILLYEDSSIRDTFLSGSETDIKNYHMVFGTEAPSSNYSFYETILNTTVNDISIFLPLEKSIPASIFLIQKKIIVLGGPIYKFETNYIRGFQFGDRASKYVAVEFFDKKDKQYSMVIRGATSNEIDFILSSIASD